MGNGRWVIGLVVVLMAVNGVMTGVTAGAAAAQDEATATIVVQQGSLGYPYEYVVYPATPSGTRGQELVRETTSAQRWTVDVPPGCYAVSITDRGPGADWSDPIANQPAFCLDAGRTEVFEPGGLLPTSPGRAVLNGEVVDPAGNAVAGVTVDFFDPPPGLGANEIRRLDHEAVDHRGPYRFSRTTDVNGWYRYNNVSPECFIQTFAAPAGYRWSGGRSHLNRSACSSEYDVLTAYPDTGPSPEAGSVEIEVPGDLGATRLTGTIAFDGDDPRPDTYWFRAFEYPYSGRLLVPPGCHVARFDLAAGSLIWTASGRAEQEVSFCVDPGGAVVVAPIGGSREVAYDLAQPFLTGGFVTGSGAAVDGVQVDLFYPRPGVTDDELRGADHSAVDHRGAFYRSSVSGPDGRFTMPIYQSCLVATLIAPDGFAFETGTYLQLARCQGDDLAPIVLTPVGGEPVDYGGRVVDGSGAGVEGLLVDVFRPVEGISDEELRSVDHRAVDYRGAYVATVETGPDGRFAFRAEPACWVLTYVGRDDTAFSTGRYLRQTLCPGDSPVVVTDVDPTEGGTIRGTVSGGPEITVDLFAANADGSRGPWLGDTTSDAGAYAFSTAAGCYVAVLIAPYGYVFAETGGPYRQLAGCVDDGATVVNRPAVLIAS